MKGGCGLIQYEKVSFSYTESRETGVKDISLFINAGECIVFCGRSGCGKTTLLRLINGLVPNFFYGDLTGTVKVDGLDIKETPLYKVSEKAGSVFQNPRSQFFNADVNSEIAFGMENLAWDNVKMQERFDKTVQELNIKNLCGRDIFSLSGGEKQKVAFASVDTVAPDIYVLDEPSSNLDADTLKLLSGYLKELKTKGKTIVIAEHRLNYLMDIADRYIYLDQGRILAEYTPGELYQMEETLRKSKGLRSVDFTGNRTETCTREGKAQTAGGAKLAGAVKTASEAEAETENVAETASEVEIENEAETENEAGLAGKNKLSIHNLTLYREDRILFNNLNLTAYGGSITAVVGKNGTGKTTLVRMLCGLYKQYAGEIKFNEKTVTDKERLKKSYMVMQDVNYQLFSEEVLKECTFGMKARKEAECEKVLKQLGLWDKRKLHPNTLSGGEKQRLAVAVSILSGKDIIIFDEPTSGLDYDSMVRVCGILKELSEMGKIILVVTHDYELIEHGKFRIWNLEAS